MVGIITPNVDANSRVVWDVSLSTIVSTIIHHYFKDEIPRKKFHKPERYCAMASWTFCKHTINFTNCLQCVGSTTKLIIENCTDFRLIHGLKKYHSKGDCKF